MGTTDILIGLIVSMVAGLLTPLVRRLLFYIFPAKKGSKLLLSNNNNSRLYSRTQLPILEISLMNPSQAKWSARMQMLALPVMLISIALPSIALAQLWEPLAGLGVIFGFVITFHTSASVEHLSSIWKSSILVIVTQERVVVSRSDKQFIFSRTPRQQANSISLKNPY